MSSRRWWWRPRRWETVKEEKISLQMKKNSNIVGSIHFVCYWNVDPPASSHSICETITVLPSEKSEFHPHILKETPIRWWRWSLSTESSFSKIFFSFSFVLFRFVPLIVLIFLDLAANHSTNGFRVFFFLFKPNEEIKERKRSTKRTFCRNQQPTWICNSYRNRRMTKIILRCHIQFFVEFCALPDDAEERKQNSPDFLFNHFSDHNNWSSSSQLQSEGFQKKTRIIFVCLYKPTKQQKKNNSPL